MRQLVHLPEENPLILPSQMKQRRTLLHDPNECLPPLAFDAPGIDRLPYSEYNHRRQELEQAEMARLRQSAINKVKKYRKKPLLFVRDELGIPITKWPNDLPPDNVDLRNMRVLPLWSKQREIVEAMFEYRRVAVKSCHGPGKTFTAGLLSIVLAYVWHALGVTTAPTGRQVEELLWQEIHFIYNQANAWRQANGMSPLGGRLLQTKLDLGDKWFVLGFSTDKKEANIPGFHEETVFVIVDEACGVDPGAFDLLETILTSENAFVLYIGNPNDPNTEFARSFRTNSGFKTFTISAFDIPNVKHNRVLWPKLTTMRWVKERKNKWGEESALYLAKVLGEFPDTNEDSLISYADIVAAQERQLSANQCQALGLDVARLGGDRIICGALRRSGHYREEFNVSKKRLTYTQGRTLIVQSDHAYKELNPETDKEELKYPVINVDDVAVGGGCTDHFMEANRPVNGINVSESAEIDMTEGEDHEIFFLNKRSYYYWQLAKRFKEGKIDIDPDDDELVEELLAIETEYTSKGVIKIIDKDKIKKTLGRSPDKAEALMLANSEKEAEFDADNMVIII